MPPFVTERPGIRTRIISRNRHRRRLTKYGGSVPSGLPNRSMRTPSSHSTAPAADRAPDGGDWFFGGQAQGGVLGAELGQVGHGR
jgi:hypothetical protein